MAADLTETAPLEQPAPEPAPEKPAFKPLHRRRFLFLYTLLAVVLAAAVAGVVLEEGSSVTGSAAWSTWKPSAGGISAARQIAAHVAPEYRLPSGKQLVDVIAKAPSVSPGSQQIPVHYLAVRGSGGSGDRISDVSSSNTVMFSLCGLGASCSIATGTASVARGRLVRREILELALYTFKYVDGIENVIAFMPPRPGAQPEYVVYLQESDLSAQLDEPLADTLGPKTPLPNTIPAREVRVVDATTESRVYAFSLSQAQQGDAILVLAPLPS
ncbi:MAG TPA: hypothetical protein VFJ77_04780 [Gaiellaceae bacterium]|nr:hypothetical protein [Gaiellaceae bacterium]